jgi:hypothetical protein
MEPVLQSHLSHSSLPREFVLSVRQVNASHGVLEPEEPHDGINRQFPRDIADPRIVLKPFLNRASLDDSRPHHGKYCRLNCFGVEPVDPRILPDDNLDPSPIEIETLCFMCASATWNKIRLLMRAYLSNNNDLSGKHMRNCCAHDTLRTTCVRRAIERGCVSLDCARHTRGCIGRWTDRVVHKSYKNHRTHSRIQTYAPSTLAAGPT